MTPETALTIVAPPALELPCYAVKVRARGEDAVAELLREKGYAVLAPGYLETRIYSDRVKRVRCALFPGYVFVRMDAREMLHLLSTSGVSYVVRTGAGLEPLSPEETATIEALSGAAYACRPSVYYVPGQRVRIEEGAFAGLEGVLEKVRDESRVVVQVQSLFQSVSVAIGASAIRVIDEQLELVSA